MSGGAYNRRIASLFAVCVGVFIASAWWMLRDTDGLGGLAQSNGDAALMDIRHTEPKWLKWQEREPIPTRLAQPTGIAVDASGRLAIAGDHKVRVVTMDGAEVWSVDLVDHEATAVAYDADGTLYVGASDHIETYDKQGKGVAVWQAVNANARITSISVGPSGVYIADANNKAISRYSKRGELLNGLAAKNPAASIDGLVVPSAHLDVALGADGLVRVANPGRHAVETYKPDGPLVAKWSREGNAIDQLCGCCNPTDIALLGSDVVTAEKGLARVKVYDAGGTLKSVVAGCEALDQSAKGIDLRTDGSGRVYVMDPVRKAVRVFTAKGSGR